MRMSFFLQKRIWVFVFVFFATFFLPGLAKADGICYPATAGFTLCKDQKNQTDWDMYCSTKSMWTDGKPGDLSYSTKIHTQTCAKRNQSNCEQKLGDNSQLCVWNLNLKTNFQQVVNVKQGEKSAITISAPQMLLIKPEDFSFSCPNCSDAKLVDQKNGTATLTYDIPADAVAGQDKAINVVAEYGSVKFTWLVIYKISSSGNSGGGTGAGNYCACKVVVSGTGCNTDGVVDVDLKSKTSKQDVFVGAIHLVSCPLVGQLTGKFDTTKIDVNESTCDKLSESGSDNGINYSITCSLGAKTPASGITKKYLEGQYGVPDGYKGPLPACAFSGTCRKTNDLLELLINIAKFLFSIIGVVAFAAFVYGGFMMIFSFGNSDKVGQGKDAMVAAVVGLIIAFGAYMIINFILNTLQVTSEFRGIIN